MPKMAEYKDVNDTNRAKLKALAESYSPKVQTDVQLIHSSEGYEPAGSMARWTNDYYAVRYHRFGAIQGRRYLTEAEAREHFARLTV